MLLTVLVIIFETYDLEELVEIYMADDMNG